MIACSFVPCKNPPRGEMRAGKLKTGAVVGSAQAKSRILATASDPALAAKLVAAHP
jgi:hypothetical protein